MVKELMVPRCKWATTGTLEDGSFAPPRKCVANKCNGGPFGTRPLCTYYEGEPSVRQRYEKQMAALGKDAKERAFTGKLKISGACAKK